MRPIHPSIMYFRTGLMQGLLSCFNVPVRNIIFNFLFFCFAFWMPASRVKWWVPWLIEEADPAGAAALFGWSAKYVRSAGRFSKPDWRLAVLDPTSLFWGRADEVRWHHSPMKRNGEREAQSIAINQQKTKTNKTQNKALFSILRCYRSCLS